MSARLITQLAEDLPVIGLVSAPSSFSQEVAQYCQRQEFQVVQFQLSDLNKALEQSQTKAWYKTIVLLPFVSVSEVEVAAKLIDQLESATTPLTLIITFPSLLASEMPEYRRWQEFSQSMAQLWPQIEQISEKSSVQVFVGRDVVIGGQWLPGNAITSEIPQGKVLDPGLQFSLQTQDQFWRTLKKEVFKPSSETVVIQGQERESTVIVRELQRQLNVGSAGATVVQSLPASPLSIDIVGKQVTVENEVPDLATQLLSSISTRETTGIAGVLTTPSISPARALPKPQPQAPPKTTVVRPTDTVVQHSPKKDVAKPVVKSVALQPETPKRSPEPDAEIIERVQSVFSQQRTYDKQHTTQELLKAETKAQGKKKHRQWVYYVAVFFLVAGLGMLGFFSSFFVTGSLVKQGIWSALEPLEAEQSSGRIPTDQLKTWTPLASLQSDLFAELVPPAILGELPHWIELGSAMITVEEQQAAAQQQLAQIVAATLNAQAQPLADKLKLEEVFTHTSQLSALWDQVLQASTLPGPQQSLAEAYLRRLQDEVDQLVVFQRLQPILPVLVGSEDTRKYALVFQNNQELRPTGGFIQSVAIVTIKSGQVIDKQIYSVYELDSQLQASVTPPTEVTQLLGEENWYLRDSNWNPDFAQAAENIEWFLEKETGQPLDGIIALNTFVLEDILEALGPVDVAEFNEIITHKNLAERLEFHSEVQLVETTDQQEYPELVFDRILERTLNVTSEDSYELLQVILQNAQEKQLLVYFSESGEQTTFQALGWSGALVVPDCPTQLHRSDSCTVDSLAVIDANIGVNKANYHLQRQESHQVDLGITSAQHRHQVVLSNTSKSNAWPQGPYSSYLRFYLPKNAQVGELRINDQTIASDAFMVTNQALFKVVGIVTQTPIQQQTTVNLRYTTPLPQSPEAYAFFYQKQPGVTQPLSAITLTHDPSRLPQLIAPQAEVSPGAVTFTDFGEDHAFVGVGF